VYWTLECNKLPSWNRTCELITVWLIFCNFLLFVVYFMTLSRQLDYIASMIGWQVCDDDEWMRTNICALSGIQIHSKRINWTSSIFCWSSKQPVFLSCDVCSLFFKSSVWEGSTVGKVSAKFTSGWWLHRIHCNLLFPNGLTSKYVYDRKISNVCNYLTCSPSVDPTLSQLNPVYPITVIFLTIVGLALTILQQYRKK
jgi:hypothetical protein